MELKKKEEKQERAFKIVQKFAICCMPYSISYFIKMIFVVVKEKDDLAYPPLKYQGSVPQLPLIEITP
jgi:hypothetical protein